MGSALLNNLQKAPAGFNLTLGNLHLHVLILFAILNSQVIHTAKKKLQNWEAGVTEFQIFRQRELVCLTLPPSQSHIIEKPKGPVLYPVWKASSMYILLFSFVFPFCNK